MQTKETGKGSNPFRRKEGNRDQEESDTNCRAGIRVRQEAPMV